MIVSTFTLKAWLTKLMKLVMKKPVKLSETCETLHSPYSLKVKAKLPKIVNDRMLHVSEYWKTMKF